MNSATNDSPHVRCRSRLLEACLILIVLSFSARNLATQTPSNAVSPQAVAAGGVGPRAAVSDPFHIEMTGTRQGWHVRYPGANGDLETGDDITIVHDVHVPQDSNVVIRLKSSDYVYVLAIPDLGLKEAAVPGLEFRMELRQDHAGDFPLVGDQLCGEPDPHPGLRQKLVVEPRDEFLRWLNDQPPKNLISGPH